MIDTRTDRQTQAITSSKGQNWPLITQRNEKEFTYAVYMHGIHKSGIGFLHD